MAGQHGRAGAKKQCRRKGLGFEPRFGERHIAVTQVAPRAASHAHAALLHSFTPSDDNPTFSTSPRVWSSVHTGTRQLGPQPACLTSPHAPGRSLSVPFVLSRAISFHVFRVPPEWGDKDRRY